MHAAVYCVAAVYSGHSILRSNQTDTGLPFALINGGEETDTQARVDQTVRGGHIYHEVEMGGLQ